jgi:hypothetical protein
VPFSGHADLPAVSIQQDDLKGGQVMAVGEQAIGLLADVEPHQAMDGCMRVVVIADPLIGELRKQAPGRRRQ